MDPAQRRSRIVIAIFVGAAIVIAIFMISGTFRQLDQQRVTVTSGS
jgi:ABC-type Fe3+-siderophore transport system permease subunit